MPSTKVQDMASGAVDKVQDMMPGGDDDDADADADDAGGAGTTGQ